MTRRSARLSAAIYAAAFWLAVPSVFAAEPAAAGAGTTAPAPAQTLSPAVQAAINDLSSEDFKTREAALKNLQIALGEQMRALVASDDPETQSRLISLLQFNEGLSRWIVDTYKLPNDQRKAAIDFGLQPDILPILALVFSPEPEKRIQGAKALAKSDSSAATELLGRLLNDSERSVYLAAMEAIWDRKPNDAIVDALWTRAVDAGLNPSQGAGAIQQQSLKFRGRQLPNIVYYDYSAQKRTQDGNIAADVLVNLKAPQVNAKIKSFLEGYLKATDGSNPNANAWVYNGNSEPMKNALKLIAAYKSKDSVDILLKIIGAPITQRQQAQINGEKCFWTNRTNGLATLVIALDQKLEDYSVKRSMAMGGIWTSSSEADEDAAIKKIREYCAANADSLTKSSGDKSDKKSAPVAATTKPAEPAPAPAQPNAPAVNHIIIQGGGNIQIRGNFHAQIAPPPANDEGDK